MRLRFTLALAGLLCLAGAGAGILSAGPVGQACGYPLSACWQVSGSVEGIMTSPFGDEIRPLTGQVRIKARWSSQCSGGPCPWNPAPWGGSSGVYATSSGDFTINSPNFVMPGFAYTRDLRIEYFHVLANEWVEYDDCTFTVGGPAGPSDADPIGYFPVSIPTCQIPWTWTDVVFEDVDENEGEKEDDRDPPVIGEADPCAPPGMGRADLHFTQTPAKGSSNLISGDGRLRLEIRQNNRDRLTAFVEVANSGNEDYRRFGDCLAVLRVDKMRDDQNGWNPEDADLDSIDSGQSRGAEVHFSLSGTASPIGSPWPNSWRLVQFRVIANVHRTIPESDWNDNEIGEYCYDAENMTFVQIEECKMRRAP